MHERARRVLAEQASFARGYSRLYARVLELLGAWLADPEASARRLDRAELATRCPRIAEFIAREEWNNELEPTLRLGASLHALVLDGDPRVSELSAYYATVGGSRDPAETAFELVLADVVLALGAQLVEDAERWRVRTNETSRGVAWLLPAVLVGAEAVHLVELGASAGLNLYAEQRAYDLSGADGRALRLGRADGEQFRVSVEGEPLPALPSLLCRGPEVLTRVGCDTDPVDLGDPAAARVLAACVWGDQARRLERLREGLAVHQRARTGDLSPAAEVRRVVLPDDLVPFLEQAVPRQPVAPVISLNTYVTAYLNDVDQREVARRLGEFARSWSMRHRLPWMWVRFEPARAGEEQPAWPGFCRWRVELWEGPRHRRVELGWAHPHFVRAHLGPGLLELDRIRTDG